MDRSKPEVLTLEFDLHELPTAQHKAGLAGLLCLIETMEKSGERLIPKDCIPKILKVPEPREQFFARLEFTERSMQRLFDELYDVCEEEQYSKTKWNGEDECRVVEVEVTDKDKKNPIAKFEATKKNSKVKTVKYFVYNVVRPRGCFLSHHLQEAERSPWLRLWRDMIWQIPRGNPQARIPFMKRAEDQGSPGFVGADMWGQLKRFEKDREKNRLRTTVISGPLMLGAQATNAEGVPFYGQINQNFLLHFWQVASLTFVPQVLDNTGKLEQVGFVLVIPEVSDLKEFKWVFPRLLHSLDPKWRGIRPEGALIDIPEQGILEWLRHSKDLAAEKAAGKSWADTSIAAAESFHMARVGKNIKLLAFDRVVLRPGLVDDYEAVRGTYKNPIFRSALIRNVLHSRPWYTSLSSSFNRYPWSLFLEDEKTPKYWPRFGKDARRKFDSIAQSKKSNPEKFMSNEINRLSDIVQRMVRSYINKRTEQKIGINRKSLKDAPKHERDRFNEVRRKVCSDAFLSMRSRHDQDFVNYFVGTICSVQQNLVLCINAGNAKQKIDDYRFLASILLRKSNQSPTGESETCWEDVRALAMIAVSSCGYAPVSLEPNAQRSSS